MTDHSDQPEAGEDHTPDTENEAAEVQLDDEGNPIEEEGEDEDDLEHEGKTYRVPKTLKEKLAEAQAVEQTRADLETARQQFEERQRTETEAFQKRVDLHRQFATELAEVRATDTLIAKWRDFVPQTQEEVDQRRDALDTLKDERERLGQALGAKMNQAQREDAQQAQQAEAKALTDFTAGLKKIPGWTEEVGRAVFADAATRYAPAELAAIRDPRIVHDLLDAYRYRQSQKSTARRQQVTDQPTPPKPLRGGGAPTPLSDKASTDAWMKARQSQIERRS